MKKMDNSSIDVTPSLPLQVMHSTFSGESWKIKLTPTVEGSQGVDTHQEGVSMLGLLLTFKKPGSNTWKFWDVSDNIVNADELIIQGGSNFQVNGWIFKA